MKKIVFILAFFACYSCGQDAATKGNPVNSSQEAAVEAKNSPRAENDPTLKGTDSHSSKVENGTMVFTYAKHTVKETPNKESVGTVIEVTEKGSGKKFVVGGNDLACYFKGLSNNKMIVDLGTGTIREVRIYDLGSSEQIFENQALTSLTIEGNNLLFQEKVEITDKNQKPECPDDLKGMEDSIGYTEDLSYDLSTGKLNRSGKFACQYFE